MVTTPTPEHFRAAMAALPTGVTIVTAVGDQGPAGATANAVCSLSLDPPLMLACLDRGSRTLDVVRAHGRFGISVLAADQEPIARAFASKAPHTEKFREVPIAEHATVPILAGSAAWVACALRDLHEGGDHQIAVGDVLDLGVGQVEPLIWFGGGYRALG
jgi:flavin reductase (DIM6/NTAB) family NADH-FMN oxidoreductase RutF